MNLVGPTVNRLGLHLFLIIQAERRGSVFNLMPECKEQSTQPKKQPFNLIIALEQEPGLMSIERVAALLDSSVSTVYRKAQKKQLPSMMIGGSRKFDPSVLSMHFGKKYPDMLAAARWIRNGD